MATKNSSPRENTLLLLAALFILEMSLTVMAMALYIKGQRPFATFLSSNPGGLFLMAVAGALPAGAMIVWQYLVSKRTPSRHFRLIVTMNLVTVLVILITGEIAIRIVTQSTPKHEILGNIVLKPRHWKAVASHYRQVLDQAAGFLSYLVYDDLMGWTVGPHRRSSTGRHSPVPYWSSSEGIRAPHEGVSFAQLGGKTRIALLGDSFAFGDEVTYEETWGDHLEKALGPDFQVLNFGVTAYGMGQAYLRFERDVRKWNPKIVIFGFISDDLERTMRIYGFLAFPGWDIPFSKPRFIMRDGALTTLNVPPLTPDAIFSQQSITDLPFLEYDRSYRQSDWTERLYHLSYLARLFVSRFDPWSAVSPDVSDQALVTVNAAILKTFIRSAEQAGMIPLLVYFPTKQELDNRSAPLPVVKRVLQQANIGYTDTTPCLLEVNPADRFVPSGRHYSPYGNAAVANCLLNVVRQGLAQDL
jgi:hypothetical protein